MNMASPVYYTIITQCNFGTVTSCRSSNTNTSISFLCPSLQKMLQPRNVLLVS